ncbi:hypothetical protein Hanom_Chr12g01161701 [Helianthus anomalus]
MIQFHLYKLPLSKPPLCTIHQLLISTFPSQILQIPSIILNKWLKLPTDRGAKYQTAEGGSAVGW